MQISWAVRLLLKTPFGANAVVKFRKFAIACATKRQEKGSVVKDLFYHLVRCSFIFLS